MTTTDTTTHLRKACEFVAQSVAALASFDGHDYDDIVAAVTDAHEAGEWDAFASLILDETDVFLDDDVVSVSVWLDTCLDIYRTDRRHLNGTVTTGHWTVVVSTGGPHIEVTTAHGGRVLGYWGHDRVDIACDGIDVVGSYLDGCGEEWFSA